MSEAWTVGGATILDPTGLHARPAVKLTKRAKGFESRVEIAASADGPWINAKSPNAVMKLKAGAGTILAIRADGPDAAAAVAALEALIAADFDESAG
jgi:Phosphotransferase System HPr (HPr) Family